MNRNYLLAGVVFTFGLLLIVASLIRPSGDATSALIVGSAAGPVAVMLAVSGVLKTDPEWRTLAAGATLGVVIALIAHGLVLSAVIGLLAGTVEELGGVFESVGVDSRLTALLDSPYILLLIIELVIVAPLVEEFAKAVAARLGRNADRRTAFALGVAAGTGFAIIENILYATGWGFAAAWQEIALTRMLGSAVHPLASGLVVLAWWEWRNRSAATAISLAASGVLAHAAWNGSLVSLIITGEAFADGITAEAALMTSVAFTSTLGIAYAGALWAVATSVDRERESLLTVDLRNGRLVAAWTLLGAVFLIPVAVLMLAFPAAA